MFNPIRRPSQHTYEAPSSVAGYDREICFVVLNPVSTFPNRKVKSGVGKLRERSLVDCGSEIEIIIFDVLSLSDC